jgi:hypothetical protein
VAYYHKQEAEVDFLFVGHNCFERPGIYADSNGAYADNQFRFTLLSLACCEAPLVRAPRAKEQRPAVLWAERPLAEGHTPLLAVSFIALVLSVFA